VPIYDTTRLVPSGRFGDESPYINKTAQYAGNIDVTNIDAGHISPLKGITEALRIIDEPAHAASHGYWILALMEEAKACGIGTLLTGQGGNAIISWNGSGYLAKLARSMRWRVLIKEIKTKKPLNIKSLYRMLFHQTVKPNIPNRLLKLFNQTLEKNSPWDLYSAINQDFAKLIDLTTRMYRSNHDPRFNISHNTLNNRYKLIKPGRSYVGHLWQLIGNRFGMDVRDPTTDKRVMEFCLSIPDDQHIRDGCGRFLIRRAMSELMPHGVLWNNLSGQQAADITYRLLNDLDAVEEVLEKLNENDLAKYCCDLFKMRAVLNNLKKEIRPTTTFAVNSVLLRGLMTGIFLSTLS
jgi:asparagine synthase (glutamine-hydrolysing)